MKISREQLSILKTIETIGIYETKKRWYSFWSRRPKSILEMSLYEGIREALRKKAYKKTPIGFTKDAKLIMGKDILDGKVDWSEIIQVGYIVDGTVCDTLKLDLPEPEE